MNIVRTVGRVKYSDRYIVASFDDSTSFRQIESDCARLCEDVCSVDTDITCILVARFLLDQDSDRLWGLVIEDPAHGGLRTDHECDG